MLSDKLKSKGLHDAIIDAKRESERRQKHEARMMLNSAVEDLVTGMRAVELDGLYDRETIEDFVSRRLEEYEKTLYLMDDEEFDRYLDARLLNAIARRRLAR